MELHTNKTVVQIDEEDAIVTCFKWHDVDGYARRKWQGNTLELHIVIAERVYGPVPKGMIVDHKDRNPCNCRRSNLRIVSKSVNAINRSKRSDNSSGYIGVSQDKGKWRGHVGFQGEQHRTKLYNTPEEAAQARDTLAQKLQGEYAQLNSTSG
jgi:hypothetical protein